MHYSRSIRIRRFVILIAFIGASATVDDRAFGIGMPGGAPGAAGVGGAGGIAYYGGGNPALSTQFSPISLTGGFGLGYPAGIMPYTPINFKLYLLGVGMTFLPAVTNACANMANNLNRPEPAARAGLDAAETALDQAPPEPIDGLSERDSRRDGDYGTSHVIARGGTCQKFYDTNFHLSGWGIAIREHMKEHPRAFTEIVPRDIGELCPSFRLMSPAQREAFWVEVFAALATPESQCNARQENRNAPNGTAKGLYQLFEPQCPATDATDLLNPYKNIDCAVGKFAHELEARESIMTDSRKSPTYWGTLRTNPAAIDAGASKTFKEEVRNFPGCQSQYASNH